MNSSVTRHSHFRFNDEGNMIDGVINLPNELGVMILSFLTKKELLTCSQLSKNWRNLSADKKLWEQIAKHLKINQSYNYLTDVIEKIRQLKIETDCLLEADVIPGLFDKNVIVFMTDTEKWFQNRQYKMLKKNFNVHMHLMRDGLMHIS